LPAPACPPRALGARWRPRPLFWSSVSPRPLNFGVPRKPRPSLQHRLQCASPHRLASRGLCRPFSAVCFAFAFGRHVQLHRALNHRPCIAFLSLAPHVDCLARHPSCFGTSLALASRAFCPTPALSSACRALGSARVGSARSRLAVPRWRRLALAAFAGLPRRSGSGAPAAAVLLVSSGRPRVPSCSATRPAVLAGSACVLPSLAALTPLPCTFHTLRCLCAPHCRSPLAAPVSPAPQHGFGRSTLACLSAVLAFAPGSPVANRGASAPRSGVPTPDLTRTLPYLRSGFPLLHADAPVAVHNSDAGGFFSAPIRRPRRRGSAPRFCRPGSRWSPVFPHIRPSADTPEVRRGTGHAPLGARFFAGNVGRLGPPLIHRCPSAEGLDRWRGLTICPTGGFHGARSHPFGAKNSGGVLSSLAIFGFEFRTFQLPGFPRAGRSRNQSEVAENESNINRPDVSKVRR